MSDQTDDAEERRRQGIRLKLPGGTEVEIRGLTTIMALLLVLTGVNSWIGWTLVGEMGRVADSMTAMARAQNLSNCYVVELDPLKRKERYEECARWFK